MSILTDIISGVISPVTNVLGAWLNKKEDTKVATGEQDVNVIRARADLAKAALTDRATQAGHWLFIIPTGVWYSAIVADSLIHRLGLYSWRVEALPTNLDYVPYAVVAYLFVTAWRQ